MVEIIDERVTKVWKHGMEKYEGREDMVRKHLGSWILAAVTRSQATQKIPPVELVWREGLVVGVRAHV